MKRVYISVAATCLAILALALNWYHFMNLSGTRDHLTVGFIYDNDESTCYTYNFSLAKDAVEKEYGDSVDIYTCSNVLDDQIEEPIRELAGKGCDILFFNGYSELVPQLAAEFPDIEFCQTSYTDTVGMTAPDNYHTFKGEAYQGRYVSGIVAGMKLQQMIDEGALKPDEALMGFVAAYATPEVISGYTAFLLGARSVVPTVKLRVRYTGTWSSYSQEKAAARALIDEGCVVISRHTDTIGPAGACEEASLERAVWHVGYNQSMAEVAPGTSLVATRICWEPYVTAAVDAVMRRQPIERVTSGRVHGNDVSAGFERGWVEVMDLNPQIAAPGTQQAVDSAIEQFRRGDGSFVFRGDYTGVDPHDPGDTCDLRNGWTENANSSYPTFHYLLPDVIVVE